MIGATKVRDARRARSIRLHRQKRSGYPGCFCVDANGDRQKASLRRARREAPERGATLTEGQPQSRTHPHRSTSCVKETDRARPRPSVRGMEDCATNSDDRGRPWKAVEGRRKPQKARVGKGVGEEKTAGCGRPKRPCDARATHANRAAKRGKKRRPPLHTPIVHADKERQQRPAARALCQALRQSAARPASDGDTRTRRRLPLFAQGLGNRRALCPVARRARQDDPRQRGKARMRQKCLAPHRGPEPPPKRHTATP